MVVAILSNAGDQIPVIPLLDVVGKAFSVPPWHIGATAVKVGTVGVSTVIVIVVVVAHCPAVGVKI